MTYSFFYLSCFILFLSRSRLKVKIRGYITRNVPFWLRMQITRWCALWKHITTYNVFMVICWVLWAKLVDATSTRIIWIVEAETARPKIDPSCILQFESETRFVVTPTLLRGVTPMLRIKVCCFCSNGLSSFVSRRVAWPSYTMFTRCDRRGDRSRDRSPRRSPRVNTLLITARLLSLDAVSSCYEWTAHSCVAATCTECLARCRVRRVLTDGTLTTCYCVVSPGPDLGFGKRVHQGAWDGSFQWGLGTKPR